MEKNQLEELTPGEISPDGPNGVEIHNDNVQEILGPVPQGIIQWGIVSITLSIFLILTGSWFVKYPDAIETQITITSQIPPASIIAQSSGYPNLLVKNGENIIRGATLGFIENPTNFSDVKKMEKVIGEFPSIEDEFKLIRWLELVVQGPSLFLGDLQPHYETFLKQCHALLVFYNVDKNKLLITHLENKISTYKKLKIRLNQQKTLLKNEMEMNNVEFISDSTLWVNKAISERDFNNSRLSLLEKKRSLEEIEISILNNQIQIDELDGRIQELIIEQKKEEEDLQSELIKSLKVLESQYSIWKQQYVLESPIAGEVVLFDYWSESQFVNTGTEVMTIVPKDHELFGIIKMPIARSGKVREDQEVNISLANYPAEEFGMVKGVINYISPVPSESFYLINIQLPNGLNTTYGRTLSFRQQELQGTADIITEDLRLIERVFYQFRSLLNQT